MCLCSDSEGCEGVEDVAVSGVVLTQHYLSKILSHLQATQSDAIGAPKVRLSHLKHTFNSIPHSNSTNIVA